MIVVKVIVEDHDGEVIGKTELKYEVPSVRQLDASDVMQDVGDFIEERL